jgi:hypothetical protein
MVEYDYLMKLFSTPRPNGSHAERETSRLVKAWLQERGIPFRVHSFTHYPYFFECIGAWLILSRLLLSAAIWLRWGWVALPVALIAMAGATLDQAFHWPLVTWPGARRGENIIIEFPLPDEQSEIIFSAHYDSKTELLDHNQRMFFLKAIPFGIFLTLALAFLGPLDQILLAQGSAWAEFTHRLGVVLSLPLLFLAGGLGFNMLLGRFIGQPSQGAGDNGAACAVLLGLAASLAQQYDSKENDGSSDIDSECTRVTLALFTGEEVDRQGSRAYAAWRDRQERGWPLPIAAVNMEAMAQNGDYVYWEKEGSIFRLRPTHPQVNLAIREAVAEVTGAEPVPGGPMISDSAAFLVRGFPTGVLGTYDKDWHDSGFHRPSDNLSRIMIERLPEGVEILRRLTGKLPEVARRGKVIPSKMD